jgi:transcriptional regulator with GAF, ATPase, and Fis domain
MKSAKILAAFQAKLLRVLHDGELERVDGNRTIKDRELVTATNKNLAGARRLIKLVRRLR